MKGYPRRFLPGLVAAFGVLAASGLLLVPGMLDLRFGFDVAWRLSGSQRVWIALLHSALALTMCGFAGALWSMHMRVGWRSRRHVVSGIATTCLLAATALTSLGVLYFGNELSLMTASASHTVFGLATVIWGGAHWAIAIIERAGRR